MKIFTFSVLLLISMTSYSQVPEITWQGCFGTVNDDYHICLIDSGEELLIAMGLLENKSYFNKELGNGDIKLIQFNTERDIVWEKYFGGSETDIPVKLIKSADNGYYLLGLTYSEDGDIQSQNNGGGDFWVVKMDSSKDIIWEKCLGTPYYDEPIDIIRTPDGGVAVTGNIHAGGGDVSVYYGGYDIWLFKLDSMGTLEWEKAIGNENDEKPGSMILNSENNLMILGSAQEHGGIVECFPHTGWKDVWLVEVDLYGNILSQNCYGGSEIEFATNIIEIENGFLFTAYTDSNDGDVSGLHGPPGGPPDGNSDIWIVKIDDQLNIVWQKCIGGYNSDSPDYLIGTQNNGFLIVGYTNSNDGDVSGNHSNPVNNYSDIWIVQLDSVAEIKWQHCYGGYGREWIWYNNAIFKGGEHDYIIGALTDYGPSYDVGCIPHGGLYDHDFWVFETRDCDYYAPTVPVPPAGSDTVCTLGNPQYIYTIPPATESLHYEWNLVPSVAGSVVGDSTSATLIWTTGYIGTATLVVRSVNDCGESQWSAPKYIQAVACMGIERQQTGAALRIRPNPANAYMTIEGSGRPAERIVLYDLFGQEVVARQIVSGIMAASGNQLWSVIIDLNGIDSGLYFVKIESSGNVLTGKIIIQK